MGRQRLTGLLEFYNDSWQHLLKEYYGIKVKPPITIKHKFSWTNPTKPLNKGFKKIKPLEFKVIDLYIQKFFWESFDELKQFINFSDNRMKMGDYRYGLVTEQDFSKYNLIENFLIRMKVAKETKNLEYLCDAYNMLRIQFLKTKNIHEFKDLFKYHLYLILTKAFANNWELISIDDGIHSKEKD